MDQNQLDDIIIQTAENATARSLDTIIATLRNAKGGVSPETAEKLEVIWSAWNEEDVELEPEQCAFVVEMAALGFGWAALPRELVANHGGGQLQELQLPGWPRQLRVDAVWSRQRQLRPVAAWLLGRLLDDAVAPAVDSAYHSAP